MFVSGLSMPLAWLSSPQPSQHVVRLGLPWPLAPRRFSLAVVCDAALEGIYQVDDVLALSPRLRSNELVPDRDRRFESIADLQPHTLPFLGDHPLGIAARPSPRQAIADGIS
jgi:hypothetical protein